MHELAFAEEIVKIVKKSLSAEQLPRVRKINLVIGAITALQEDCLRFALGAITEGTALTEAQVAIEHVKTRLRCKGCGKEFEPEQPFYSPCPSCGGFDTEILAGNEMSVSSVDLA